MRGPRVAALGGGHGLAGSLAALRHVTDQLTAIVTVADDGGSSGRLRRDFDILPPGDLRMALAALCDDTDWGHQWSAVLQYRFTGESELSGHALGNLLITALWQQLDDPVAGLDLVGRLLNARGRVLPMAAVPLEIEARVAGLGDDPAATEQVRGQVAVARTPGTVESISLLPEAPPARPEAVEAVREAEWVVLGPGSWFTSVMPHLMVPELRDALEETAARRLVTMNVSSHGETSGISFSDQLRLLRRHAPRLRLDVVLADPVVLAGRGDEATLREAAGELGAELVLTKVASMSDPDVHDTLRLAAAYRDVIR